MNIPLATASALIVDGEGFHRGRRREHIGEDEEADADAEGRSQNATDKEHGKPSPHRRLLPLYRPGTPVSMNLSIRSEKRA